MIPYKYLIDNKEYLFSIPIQWEDPIFDRVISLYCDYSQDEFFSNVIPVILGFYEAGITPNQFKWIKLNQLNHLLTIHGFCISIPEPNPVNVGQLEVGWFWNLLNKLDKLAPNDAKGKIKAAAETYILFNENNRELTGTDAFTAIQVLSDIEKLINQYEIVFRNPNASYSKDAAKLARYGRGMGDLHFLTKGDLTKADEINNKPAQLVLEWMAFDVEKNNLIEKANAVR